MNERQEGRSGLLRYENARYLGWGFEGVILKLFTDGLTRVKFGAIAIARARAR